MKETITAEKTKRTYYIIQRSAGICNCYGTLYCDVYEEDYEMQQALAQLAMCATGAHGYSSSEAKYAKRDWRAKRNALRYIEHNQKDVAFEFQRALRLDEGYIAYGYYEGQYVGQYHEGPYNNGAAPTKYAVIREDMCYCASPRVVAFYQSEDDARAQCEKNLEQEVEFYWVEVQTHNDGDLTCVCHV